MTAPSPGGVQRFHIPDGSAKLAVGGDWVRHGDIAGMEKERDEARAEHAYWVGEAKSLAARLHAASAQREDAISEAARLRKALEAAAHNECCDGCDSCGEVSRIAAEALRGAAGEVGK